MGIEQLREQLGYTPRGAVKRIVEHRTAAARVIEESLAALSLLPGDVARPSLYAEGATRPVFINAYERSREAVLQCKAVQGTSCVVCGLDFGAMYGPEFAGFIHIHHLRPLTETLLRVGRKLRANSQVQTNG